MYICSTCVLASIILYKSMVYHYILIPSGVGMTQSPVQVGMTQSQKKRQEAVLMSIWKK